MFIRSYTSKMWHCKLQLAQENLGAKKLEDRGFGMVQSPKICRHLFLVKVMLGELVFIRLFYITTQVSLKWIPQN